jgi:lysozyme
VSSNERANLWTPGNSTVLTVLAPVVKRFEGLRLAAYLCPAGIPTIGYGHTKGVTLGMTISEAEADALLQADMLVALRATIRECPVLAHESPAKLAAIADFTFNLGAGRLRASTLRRRINAGEFDDVPYELRRWVRAGPKVLAGLVARREADVILWQE